MMNRDPVAGLTQRRSATSDQEPESKPQEIEIPTENDEERIALELAIKRSLEDQKEPIIEVKNDISITVESPSDSDGEMK